MGAAIIEQLIAILMTFFVAFAPGFVLSDDVFASKKENILLNAVLVSDTHIDAGEFVLQGTLASGLKSLNDSKSTIDSLVVAGDLTNYGDEKSIAAFYDIVDKYSPVRTLIAAAGNHEIGHVEGATQEEARQYVMKHYNEFMGTGFEKIYFSYEVNGYKFIVLSDEADDSWDFPEISDEQIAFLDAELAAGTAQGKPVFVCCHWPLAGNNGQDIIWEDGCIKAEYGDKIRATLEKYKNVFYLSGHVHTGVNGEFINKVFGFNYVETTNGVTYVNLPTFGLVNRFGVPWPCTGVMMEVYEDEIFFRPRNFVSGRWYARYEMSVGLVK